MYDTMQSSDLSEDIIRPLGPIEKMFWLMDQNHPMHFVLAAEIVGRTEIWQWQQGLDYLCQQMTFVWSRIISDGHGEPCFQRHAPGTIQLEVSHHAPADWTATAAAQLARPFDSSHAPLLRAALLYNVERSTIILCAHHSIADGLSLTYLIRDLLKAVVGETVELRREDRNLEDIVRSSVESAKVPSQSAEPTKHPVIRKPMSYRVADESPPYMETLQLTREVTAQLRDQTRAEGCSIHGALCAALVTAHLKLMPPELGLPLRISSPVDVRRRLLDRSDHFGLCICGVVVEDEPNEVGFWDKARYFSNSLSPIKTADGMATLVSAAREGIMQIDSVRQAADLAAGLFAGEIDLSNLGEVNIPEDYGSLKLSSLWGPSVTLGFEGEQSIGAVTFGGNLRLLHMSYAPVKGLLRQASQVLACSIAPDLC
ncbi:MAG: phthiocerol/phthiodiolone dimycocerosyl transferase family protein [Janthinobacterium lividum]